MRGVDVSVFNTNVDWQAVKAAGFDFAICRTGFGRTDADETFLAQVDGAHKAGLVCGAYHYSYALNADAAAEEARFCKSVIEKAGVMLELPVWLYMGDSDSYKKRHGFEFTKANVTAICRAFLENIKPLNCGIYASYSWLTDLIDHQSLGCPVWSAQWGNEDSFHGKIWQYTDALTIGGQTFNGNILYDGTQQASAQPQPASTAQQSTPQTSAQQSAQDLIHNILSNRKDEAAPATSTEQPKPSAQNLISNILANRKDKENSAATEQPAAQPAASTEQAKPSAQNLISSILAGRKKK